MDLSPPWPERWNAGRRRWILRGIKALVIGAFLVNHTMMVLGHYQTRGTARSKPPLYGLYDVDSFVKDGQPHPPLLTDTERWRLVIFDWPGRLAVRGMDNALQVFPIELDETAGTMAIRKGQGEEAEKAAWTFERPAPGKLNLAGEWEGSTYALELTARDPEQFLLRSRGFHWIQEFPFNR